MQKVIFSLLIISFFIARCTFQGYEVSYETTVAVTDMNNKPIVGVFAQRFKTGTSQSFPPTSNSLRTNAEGKATFQYTLHVDESSQSGSLFTTEENEVWKPMNTVDQQIGSKRPSKVTIELPLRMDSAILMKVRLVKTTSKAASLGLKVNAWSSDSPIPNFVNKEIQLMKSTIVGIFDSTFTVSGYKSMPIEITAFSESTVLTKKVKATDYRNTPLVFTL